MNFLFQPGDWEGPTHLYAVQVPYVPRATCKISYEWRGKLVDDSMICAGVAGKDSCQVRTSPRRMFWVFYQIWVWNGIWTCAAG